jgi:hypothetical protein
MRRALIVVGVLVVSACADEPTLPSMRAAAGSGSGGSGSPNVTGADPDNAPQDTTLDVHILGSNFDRGSSVSWSLGGVATDKVTTNSTLYVTSKELVANVTIAVDAAPDLYDVVVTTATGKKGIGSELFAIRPKGHSEAFPEMAFSGTTNLQVMNFDGSHETVAASDTGVFTISWASTGSGTTSDPWRVIYENGSGCSRNLTSLSVAVVNGTPQGLNRIVLPTTSIACHPAWSPVADTILFAEGAMPAGQASHLFLMSAAGGPQTAIYASLLDGFATYFPVWSSDGSRIAFVEENVNNGVNDPALRVLDRATGVATTVVQPGVFCSIRALDWARTKDALAFSAFGFGRSGQCAAEQVYTLDLGTPGALPVPVVSGSGPTWSPHDGKLAYWTAGKVVTIDLATRKVTTLAGNGLWPDWRR